MSNHKCDAIVISCIDFRFQRFIQDWLVNKSGFKSYDYVGFAGSTKNIDIILEQIDIAVRLHGIHSVCLMHHEECGAYGAESTPERHKSDLNKAKNLILEKYPDLNVSLYYLHLDGEFESVD